MEKKGFTIIEILTVVIIIGILATLAIPPFIRTMDAAKGRLAKTNLKLIYAAEKVYRNEIGKFMPYGGGEATPVDDNFKKYLGLDIKEREREFAYKVRTDASGNVLSVDAEYQGSRYPGTKISINEEGAMESTFPPSP